MTDTEVKKEALHLWHLFSFKSPEVVKSVASIRQKYGSDADLIIRAVSTCKALEYGQTGFRHGTENIVCKIWLQMENFKADAAELRRLLKMYETQDLLVVERATITCWLKYREGMVWKWRE